MCGSIIPACNLSWVWNPSEENHIKKLISIVLWIDDGMSGRRHCRLKKMRLIPMCVMCRYVQLHSFYLIGQWRPALKHIQNIILPEQFISIHRGGNWGPVLFQLNHNDCDKDPSSAWYENFCAEPDLSRRPVFSSRAHKKETSLCAPHRWWWQMARDVSASHMLSVPRRLGRRRLSHPDAVVFVTSARYEWVHSDCRGRGGSVRGIYVYILYLSRGRAVYKTQPVPKFSNICSSCYRATLGHHALRCAKTGRRQESQPLWRKVIQLEGAGVAFAYYC